MRGRACDRVGDGWQPGFDRHPERPNATSGNWHAPQEEALNLDRRFLDALSGNAAVIYVQVKLDPNCVDRQV